MIHENTEDRATPRDAIYDEIEPVDETNHYREAAMMVLPLIRSGIAHCLQSTTPRVGQAQVMYALGLESRPMRQVAAQLNVSVACISRGAREFVDENNLPLPTCMKTEKASLSYSAARKKQLTKRNQ